MQLYSWILATRGHRCFVEVQVVSVCSYFYEFISNVTSFLALGGLDS